MTPDEIYLMRELAQSKCTTHYRDRTYQAMMLRMARNEDERNIIMRAIMDAREVWRNWTTVTQRQWQSKISRRPQRTRHHDSWSLREKYVRGGNYSDYLPTPGSPQR